MPYHPLQCIKWFDQELENDLKRRVVEIDGQLCKVLTSNGLVPGSFGIRMETNKTSKILLINNMPFNNDDCMCDAAYPMMPPTNTNPCWTSNHLHGFWGPAEQDNVYACVKPGEQYQYCYSINKNHPTGIYIHHVHNFSSSVTIDHITPFIVKIYDPKNPDYPRNIIQEDLFIVLAYMQRCDPDDPDGCQIESFDFPKYASGDFGTYITKLKEGPKLLLVNGQIQPIKEVPIGTPIILRIGWMGILDICRIQVWDDNGNKIKFRVLSIDSLPIAKQCHLDKCRECECDDNIMIVDEFVCAHMQRVDIMVIFDKTRQYRLMKFTTPDDDTNLFTVKTRTMMFFNVTCKREIKNCIHVGESGPNKPDQCTVYETEKGFFASISNFDVCKLKHLKLKNPYWVKKANKMFRNTDNIAGWRNMRFNYPMFPMIEGAMLDLNVQPAQVVMVANKSEIWHVTSFAGLHSLHIHLMWFLVMAERKSSIDPWKMIPKEKQWFQDTLTLFDDEEYIVWMFPFADKNIPQKLRATGLAMMHCHMGDHLDSGMMLSMTVLDDRDDNSPSGIGFQSDPLSPEILEIVEKSACIH